MLKYDDKHVRMTGVKNSEQHEKNEKSEVSEPVAKAEEIDVKGSAEVMQATADIAADIAEVGIEDAEASEGFKEREGGGRQKVKDPSPKTKGRQQDEQDLKAHIHKTIPIKTMRKEVEKEIRKEIRKEEKRVLLAYAGLKRYSPHKLSELVAKIRSLRDLLSSLVEATKEVLTGLYLKWVRKES